MNLWLIKNARPRRLSSAFTQGYAELTLRKGFLQHSSPIRLCAQLGVLMDKWNNVRVWGRQSAFWEYLWCLAQHYPFLLLTAPIHPQGQYAVLTAAMNQKRWEISSGSSHTEKCFDIMTRHQNVFTKCLICYFKASVPQQDPYAQPVPNHREKQNGLKAGEKKVFNCFVKMISARAHPL